MEDFLLAAEAPIYVIENVKVITPTCEIENGYVLIEGGVIRYVAPLLPDWTEISSQTHLEFINGKGKVLMPGIIDLHNDQIEKELEPRGGAVIPMEMALISLESKLISHGVTSIFHSVSLDPGMEFKRSIQFVLNLICEIRRAKTITAINHFIHARYELANDMALTAVCNLIDDDMLQLISFMDHTPGQGQYRDEQKLIDWMKRNTSYSDTEIRIQLENRKEMRDSAREQQIMDTVIEHAKSRNIPLASHDDDTLEKVSMMRAKGIRLSEFPVTLEAARAAKASNLFVSVGAPNLILGKSNSGNLRAIDAVREGLVDIISSDYLSCGILHAIFKLHQMDNVPLHEAVNMGTFYPAQAVGMDDQLGSIEIGKKGDLILLSLVDGFPLVEQVFVDGGRVYQKHYRRQFIN